MAKKPDPKPSKPETERVKFSGTFDELATKLVRQPSGKAPVRKVKPRKTK